MLETRQSPAAAAVCDIADRLRRNRAPAIVVAPAESRLVAANVGGARAFGLADMTGMQTDIALDSAMPAIVQLRRLAGLHGAEHHGVVEPLVFWTQGGAARVLCRVRTLDDATGRHLLLIEPLDHTHYDADDATVEDPTDEIEAEPAAVAAAATSARPETTAKPARAETPVRPVHAPANGEGNGRPSVDDSDEAGAAAIMPPVRNDADILKAIARQILGERTAIEAVETNGALQAASARAAPPPKRAAATRRAAPARERARPRDIIDLDDDATPALMAATAPPAPPSGGSDANGNDSAGGNSDDDSGGAAKSTPAAAVVPVDPEPSDTAPDQPPQAMPSAANAGTAPPATGDTIASAKPRTGLARSAIIRRIAHELKSPLSAIAAASEIMKDERFGPIGDERYLRYARDINESARHALDVVQRMLGTQVDADGAATSPQLEFTDLDLNAVIGALISTMQPLAADAGVTLATALAAPLPRVVADGTSVRQMALNLVTNAMKFTPRGGSITVSTRAEVDGPLTLEVVDTGPGMSAEELARCEAEGAADEMAPRKGGGLGIGVPLVRALARANGADLRVANRDGGGVSASIVFPKSRQVLV